MSPNLKAANQPILSDLKKDMMLLSAAGNLSVLQNSFIAMVENIAEGGKCYILWTDNLIKTELAAELTKFEEQEPIWAIAIETADEQFGNLELVSQSPPAKEALLAIQERTSVFSNLISLHKKQLVALNAKNNDLKIVNEELNSLAYSISHDFRAPIRAINGFSDFLIEDYSEVLDEEAKDLLNRIKNNALKMNALIEALLKLSRASNKEMEIETISISKLATSIVAKLKEQYQSNYKITIDENISCSGDRKLLEQLVFNLIDNAFKFSSKAEAPEISIKKNYNNRKNCLLVEDNGIGIKDYSGKIFESFQRYVRTDEYSGIGIGLAVAMRIARRHGTSLWAESAEKKRTCFYFELPNIRL